MMAPYRAPSCAWAALPPRLATELLAELEAGERVLWTGLPHRATIARRALGKLAVPFAFNGVVLAVVALCALGSPEAGLLALGLVPLLALGLPLFQAPVGAWHALRATFYAVTDRRALVFDENAIVSIDRRDIVDVRVRPLGRGSAGHIALVLRRPGRGAAALVGIPQAQRVAQMLRTG
ncbi:MAG TPA: hypothetical protein VGM06_21395 [Polyangiaceae bacterium]|jgi:hypothetical protein